VPIDEWSVCLPDHHPGYVTWDEYLATRQRLRSNVRPRGEGGGAAREGDALLQGLVRCGRCGRKMQVAYSGTNGKVGRYACVRGRDFHATGRAGAARLDRAVADAFLDAVAPAGITATAGAVGELEASTSSASPGSASRSSARNTKLIVHGESSTRASRRTASSAAPSNARWSWRSQISSASAAGSPSSSAPARSR
jgi:Recombinase zinc beta ribbon domain